MYIVRHCEAEGNITEVFQGSYDSDITEKGALQLDKLAERFRDIHLDAVVSSPLKRAYKTAEAINRYHGLEIATDPDFAEINGGELEGHKWNELSTLFPDTYALWKNDFAAFYSKEGESMKEVFERVGRGIMRVASDYRGKTVAVASHGGAIRNLLCFLDGKPLHEVNNAAWVENTSISCYEFDDELVPHKVFVNDCAHLDTPETAPHAMWWRTAE